MDSGMKKLGADGLVFFGQINASISHELKNVLATVYETAGLLDDLVEMSLEEKEELDLEYTRKLCTRVLEQIRRGNGIIKRMNSFAHSVDESVREVDGKEMVEFMVSLCERFASIRESSLDCGEITSVQIKTDPFFLELLLYRCILFSLDHVDKDKSLAVSVRPEAQGACFHISGVGDIQMEFPEPAMLELKEALQAELFWEEDKKRICLSLPGRLSNPPREVE